ncbi:MAG: hypothetical protein ACFFHD_09770 [Promethearchaeota archaeon]
MRNRTITTVATPIPVAVDMIAIRIIKDEFLRWEVAPISPVLCFLLRHCLLHRLLDVK